jgi:hypothetical protein
VKKLCHLLCLWLVFAQAWAISYTVQVAAFSDEKVATETMDLLLEQGYPAYLISAPTDQGQVYRIRVGAFANREAAALFATSMEGIAGSNPSPALAETIPGDYPLFANLLGSYDLETTSLQLFPWAEHIAIRVQAKDFSEALYKVGDLEFSAWRAAPQGEWILRMFSLPVWDPNAPDATPEQKEQYRAVVLANVADQLELTPRQVAAFEFNAESTTEPPYLVLVERWNPDTEQRELLKAIGQESSEITAYGPEWVLFQGAEVEIPIPEDDLFEPTLEMEAQDVIGANWEATEDGEYTKLETEDPAKEWRVAVGKPIWASQDLLLALHQEQLLVYRLEAESE